MSAPGAALPAPYRAGALSAGSRTSSTSGTRTWHAFSEARALNRAVQWLVEEELTDQEAVDRYQTDHPEPDLP